MFKEFLNESRAKVAYVNAWKFSNSAQGAKFAKEKVSKANGFVEILMGDDGMLIVPASARDFGVLKQAGYEVFKE